jgi:hypothetical protein
MRGYFFSEARAERFGAGRFAIKRNKQEIANQRREKG